MITIRELANLLTQIKIPVAYSHFKVTENKPMPNPPFAVYLEEDSINFGADNRVYKKFINYRIEVYTNDKNLELESRIENLLDDNKIYYETNELFIDKEKLLQRTYYITLKK